MLCVHYDFNMTFGGIIKAAAEVIESLRCNLQGTTPLNISHKKKLLHFDIDVARLVPNHVVWLRWWA